jgi:hypothetical protein
MQKVRTILLEFIVTEAEEYDPTQIIAIHDATGKVLREALPTKITFEILRHHFEPIVPDHLLIAEHRPPGSIQRWVRGLKQTIQEIPPRSLVFRGSLPNHLRQVLRSHRDQP